MEVAEKQIFNLWDTNGRRSDVLNALSIYLNILKEMKEEGTFDQWGAFPESLTQFSFYQKAIEQSPEVFKTHPQFDNLVDTLGLNVQSYITKNQFNRLIKNNPSLLETLDKAIEQRARHYTSNLVRFGFASEKRIITQAGQTYLNGKTDRDSLEEILPLNDTNLILLRQLMKLRIFSKNIDGNRRYYSPFYASLYLLLNNDTMDRDDFISIVQGLNPYIASESLINVFKSNDINAILSQVIDIQINTPIEFLLPEIVSEKCFNEKIKNRKSGSAVDCYYCFYKALSNYRENPNDITYDSLKHEYLNNKDKIKKAFCLGKNLFDFGTNGIYDHNTFLDHNKDNPFLTSTNFNSFFYECYEKSKYIDQISEYSDTTARILSASGLFRFKPSVCITNKSLYKSLFQNVDIAGSIFGIVSEEEYKKYEKEDNSIFGSSETIVEILNYSSDDISIVQNQLKCEFGTNVGIDIKTQIETKVSTDFKAYIESNYPKEKIIRILEMFSDRSNDSRIKNEVNPAATVPTIYEYIVGIAWYYISEKNFDLHSSFNMTLNADFEPEMHAGGGMGDLLINYPNMSVMLEVTLMNSSAQKRGEWEPVLRHSLNNKAEHMEEDTFTFFIANELDYNTINIWRAVAAAPLKSTNGNETEINGVVIMPFTNANIIRFLEQGINSTTIIHKVKESFDKVPKITESDWHSQIINNL